MATINKLTSVDDVSGSDQIAIWQANNADTRRATLNTLLAWMSGEITAADDKITQYSAPNAGGFTATITDSSNSAWLVLTPTGTMATGTIKLPAIGNCVERQEVLVNTTQAITSLAVDGNGSTVSGAPTTLAAGAYFRLRFEPVLSTWYRVG